MRSALGTPIARRNDSERWVISYADMVTLLFALFVVFFAIGETKLKRIDQISSSLAFAFKFAGEGKTEDEGIFPRGRIGGGILDSVQPLRLDRGSMVEYVMGPLVDEFEELTGDSLEVIWQERRLAFRARQSAFFESGSLSLRAEVQAPWLGELVHATMSFCSAIRITLRAPRQQAPGLPTNTQEWCLLRAARLTSVLALLPGVERETIEVEFAALPAAGAKSWEDVGTIELAFER